MDDAIYNVHSTVEPLSKLLEAGLIALRSWMLSEAWGVCWRVMFYGDSNRSVSSS